MKSILDRKDRGILFEVKRIFLFQKGVAKVPSKKLIKRSGANSISFLVKKLTYPCQINWSRMLRILI